MCIYTEREEEERERERKRRRIGRQGTYSTAAAGAYSDDEEDVACIIVRRGVAVKKKKKEEEEGLATSVPAMEGRNTPRRVARARGPRHILSFFFILRVNSSYRSVAQVIVSDGARFFLIAVHGDDLIQFRRAFIGFFANCWFIRIFKALTMIQFEDVRGVSCVYYVCQKGKNKLLSIVSLRSHAIAREQRDEQRKLCSYYYIRIRHI